MKKTPFHKIFNTMSAFPNLIRVLQKIYNVVQVLDAPDDTKKRKLDYMLDELDKNLKELVTLEYKEYPLSQKPYPHEVYLLVDAISGLIDPHNTISPTFKEFCEDLLIYKSDLAFYQKTILEQVDQHNTQVNKWAKYLTITQWNKVLEKEWAVESDASYWEKYIEYNKNEKQYLTKNQTTEDEAEEYFNFNCPIAINQCYSALPLVEDLYEKNITYYNQRDVFLKITDNMTKFEPVEFSNNLKDYLDVDDLETVYERFYTLWYMYFKELEDEGVLTKLLKSCV